MRELKLISSDNKMHVLSLNIVKDLIQTNSELHPKNHRPTMSQEGHCMTIGEEVYIHP